MNTLTPSSVEFWILLGASVLSGGIVGLERELRLKPAGLRTSILVCLGTAVFIRLGMLISGNGGDPTRVLGQVVTGIGFLGAGVMFTQDRSVKGVTTAAVIWVLASIGATVGLGYYPAAITLSVATVLILTGAEYLEKHLLSVNHKHRRIQRNPQDNAHPED